MMVLRDRLSFSPLHTNVQGRRRIFKSGPAKEIIECRRHERGESTRGLGGLPRENFEYLAHLCAFLMGFYEFEPDFNHDFLLEKIFLGA